MWIGNTYLAIAGGLIVAAIPARPLHAQSAAVPAPLASTPNGSIEPQSDRPSTEPGNDRSATAEEPLELAISPVGETASIVYTPADFARFAPRTALDMVNKIPDFTLTATSGDRGMGQASQNILINGNRVSGKSNDAGTELARIAASAVERIEIVDGARLGLPGLSGKVANVIVRSSRVTVQYHYDAQFRRNIQDQLTTGGISASGRLGGTDFTLSLSNDGGLRRGGVGPEFVTAADGSAILRRDERVSFHIDEPRLAGSLHRDFADGSVANLTLAAGLYIDRTRFRGLVTPADGSALYDEFFLQTEDEWNVEGNADYEFDLGGGRLKLIGLQRYEHSPTTSTFTAIDRPPGTQADGVAFDRVADEGESVLRAEYHFGGTGREWQLAVESAYNFIDVTSELATRRADGSFAAVPLPGGVSFVDEWRGEAQLTHGWTLAGGLTLQTSIGGEYSKLTQTGANGLSRNFIRPKGLVALAWTASPRLTVNASIERRVGQLNFFDFIAAVDVQNDNLNGANVRLVPSQSWRAELEIIRSLGTAGSITLGGYGEAISDIVDRIPLSPTVEGVGNLPSARRYGVTGRGTLLFDGLGWHGARLNANVEFRHSSVRDPVTSENRRISGDLIRRFAVDLRHDVPGTQIAWGGSLSEDRIGPSFRLDEYYFATLNHPIATAFVEHKDVLGMTVRLSLRNLLGSQDNLRRDVYVARRDGPVDFRERQIRSIYLIGLLSISGSF